MQYFTLCLLTRINGLASSNKALKAEWKERSKHLRLALELILDQETRMSTWSRLRSESTDFMTFQRLTATNHERWSRAWSLH